MKLVTQSTYCVKWITQGPNKSDVPGSIRRGIHKQYLGRPPAKMGLGHLKDLLNMDTAGVFEVQALLAKAKDPSPKDGDGWYVLVLWKGYPITDSSWEPK